MSSTKPRKFMPFLIAGLCLFVGIGAGIVTSRPSANGSADGSNNAALSAQQAAEAKQLEAMQEQLLSTLVFPSDYKQVPEFSLLNVNAEPIDQSLFSDRWSIVFFGFTHCPDVCPITLSVMQDVVTQLKGKDVPQPQTVFVTVDPNRDTPDVLKNYIGYFNEEFVGVTGELNGIHQLTRALGIVAAYTAREDNPKEYDVDHTASMLLIDPQGRLRGKLTAPHTADTIVTDYITIMKTFVPTQSAALNTRN